MKVNKSSRALTEKELECAYEICKLVRDHSANVLASSGFENSASDKALLKKANKFIAAYERRRKAVPYMSGVLKILELTISDIDAIKQAYSRKR